jgi:hypothetical protein
MEELLAAHARKIECIGKDEIEKEKSKGWN